jgi:hypothetical protein
MAVPQLFACEVLVCTLTSADTCERFPTPRPVPLIKLRFPAETTAESLLRPTDDVTEAAVTLVGATGLPNGWSDEALDTRRSLDHRLRRNSDEESRGRVHYSHTFFSNLLLKELVV